MLDRGVTHLLWLNEEEGRPAFSGAENHVLTLLPALRKLGVDVELLVLLWQSGPMVEKQLSILEENGVRVTRLQMDVRRRWWLGGLRFPKHIAMLTQVFRQRRGRIIHLHLDFFSQPIAAYLAGCKYVGLSIHNDELWYKQPLKRLWLKWLDKNLVGYIAISERIREYYTTVVGIPHRKIRRVYYGVHYPKSSISAQNLKENLAIPHDKIIIGFVGRLVFQKNIPLLIRAMRKFPALHCVIVGDGELRDRLKHQASDLPNVQFLGFHPRAYELFSCFDIFCLPSRYEGLGLVLLEAMLNKVPIIASNAGAIPEVLGQGQYGRLFENENLNGLITQIEFALSHPEEMRSTANRACEYALTTYAVDSMAQETLSVYRQWCKA
jgi:glycosyltransferase involved in cell wall biosynthesis